MTLDDMCRKAGPRGAVLCEPRTAKITRAPHSVKMSYRIRIATPAEVEAWRKAQVQR